MTPKRPQWVPDPGDPILHTPTGKTLTLAKILRMNGHTYYVCRKPEPYIGPPHVMLPASACARPKEKPWRKAQRPLPDPETTDEP